MNKINLVGCVANIFDFENTSAQHFTVAVKNRWSKQQDTDFIPCVCFGSTKEFFKNYFCVGKWISLTGRLSVSEYEKNGERRKNIQVIAEDIEFCGKNPEIQNKPLQENTEDEFQPFTPQDFNDDDLPWGK